MKSGRTAVKIFSVLLASVWLFTLFSFCSSAVYLEQNGSITLHVADKEKKTPIEGVAFRIYLFAAAYEEGDSVKYDYVVPYEDCKMDMDNLQDAYLAVHLAHFALTHNQPYTELKSDSDGYICFDGLKPGVYLILATDIIKNYFLPSPFVINIPVYDHETKNWEYDVNATPKMQICGGSVEATYLSVKKLWSTDGAIPEKITVSLLCDLKEVETVELSEKNNWYYRWDMLESNHTWNVVEKNVPDGFKVYYEASANSVRIINKNESSSEESTTGPEDTTTSDELVDTGQLNWPVPVFSVVGLLLFSVGWAMLNLGKKEEEAP